MNPKTCFVFALVCIAAVCAQTEEPTEEPTTTAKPGQAFGAICNGLLLQCNRHSNTVGCFVRKANPTEAPSTSENPLVSLLKGKAAGVKDICETGLGVDLGLCGCLRNCKQGIFVDDGEFDAERDICVGLVGSTCSLLVPYCTKNAQCNLLSSACICNPGYVNDGNRRCVLAKA